MSEFSNKKAIEFLKKKGGSCSWVSDDITEELSNLLLDACYADEVISCDKTETWNLKKHKES